MDVAGRVVRAQDKTLDVIGVEMKDPRLAVIDPDDGVIVSDHVRVPSPIEHLKIEVSAVRPSMHGNEACATGGPFAQTAFAVPG
jgi:hypothetical protein